MDPLFSNEPCCALKACCEVATTISDRLTQKKRRLELELAETNAALEALQQNPEVARVLTLVSKAVNGNY